MSTSSDKAKGEQARWLAKNVTDGRRHERPTGEKTKPRPSSGGSSGGSR